MTKIKEYVLFVWTYLCSFFPSKLPQGMHEFDAYMTRLYRIVSKAIPQNGSVRFGVASMMLHLGSTEHRKPLRYFMKVLEKGATAQVAVGVMEAEKTLQKARDEAAKFEAELQARIEADKKALEAQENQPTTPGDSNGPAEIQETTGQVVQQA